MKQGSKVGIVCCSNGLDQKQAETVDLLVQILEKSGFVPELSPYLYGDENGMVGTARERAQALMNFYRDDSVEEIFDVSGGIWPMRFCLIWISRPLPMGKSISGDTVI